MVDALADRLGHAYAVASAPVHFREVFMHVEIAGDEAAMQANYHGSARVREGKDIFSTFWQKQPRKPQ